MMQMDDSLMDTLRWEADDGSSTSSRQSSASSQNDMYRVLGGQDSMEEYMVLIKEIAMKITMTDEELSPFKCIYCEVLNCGTQGMPENFNNWVKFASHFDPEEIASLAVLKEGFSLVSSIAGPVHVAFGLCRLNKFYNPGFFQKGEKETALIFPFLYRNQANPLRSWCLVNIDDKVRPLVILPRRLPVVNMLNDSVPAPRHADKRLQLLYALWGKLSADKREVYLSIMDPKFVSPILRNFEKLLGIQGIQTCPYYEIIKQVMIKMKEKESDDKLPLLAMLEYRSFLNGCLNIKTSSLGDKNKPSFLDVVQQCCPKLLSGQRIRLNIADRLQILHPPAKDLQKLQRRLAQMLEQKLWDMIEDADLRRLLTDADFSEEKQTKESSGKKRVKQNPRGPRSSSVKNREKRHRRKAEVNTEEQHEEVQDEREAEVKEEAEVKAAAEDAAKADAEAVVEEEEEEAEEEEAEEVDDEAKTKAESEVVADTHEVDVEAKSDAEAEADAEGLQSSGAPADADEPAEVANPKALSTNSESEEDMPPLITTAAPAQAKSELDSLRAFRFAEDDPEEQVSEFWQQQVSRSSMRLRRKRLSKSAAAAPRKIIAQRSLQNNDARLAAMRGRNRRLRDERLGIARPSSSTSSDPAEVKLEIGAIARQTSDSSDPKAGHAERSAFARQSSKSSDGKALDVKRDSVVRQSSESRGPTAAGAERSALARQVSNSATSSDVSQAPALEPAQGFDVQSERFQLRAPADDRATASSPSNFDDVVDMVDPMKQLLRPNKIGVLHIAQAWRDSVESKRTSSSPSKQRAEAMLWRMLNLAAISGKGKTHARFWGPGKEECFICQRRSKPATAGEMCLCYSVDLLDIFEHLQPESSVNDEVDAQHSAFPRTPDSLDDRPLADFGGNYQHSYLAQNWTKFYGCVGIACGGVPGFIMNSNTDVMSAMPTDPAEFMTAFKDASRQEVLPSVLARPMTSVLSSPKQNMDASASLANMQNPSVDEDPSPSELKHQNEALRTENAAMRAELQTLRALRQENEALRAENKVLIGESQALCALRAENDALRSESKALSGENKTLRSRNDALACSENPGTEIDRLRAEVNEYRSTTAELRDIIHDLSLEADSQRQTSEKTLKAVQKQLEAEKTKNKGVKEKIKDFEDKAGEKKRETLPPDKPPQVSSNVILLPSNPRRTTRAGPGGSPPSDSSSSSTPPTETVTVQPKTLHPSIPQKTVLQPKPRKRSD